MKPSRSTPSFSERKQERDAGFTLVEILVAISMLAILVTTIYGIFTAVGATKERLDADSAAYHRARVIFDRLGREIRGTYFSRENAQTRLEGGETPEGRPYLELSTTAVSMLSRRGTGFALVRYTLAEDPEADDGSLVLLRTERPMLTGEASLEDQDAMRLAPGISAFGLRFFAGDTWHDTWDGASAGLPEMVEVTISILGQDGKETPFLSAFDLPNLVQDVRR